MFYAIRFATVHSIIASMQLKLKFFSCFIYFLEKSLRDACMKSPEGIALLKDVLFILKRVCQLTKEQKPNADNKEGDGEDNAMDDAIAQANEAGATDEVGAAKTIGATTAGNVGRGRGRRREIITMPDAVKVKIGFFFNKTY